MLLHTQILFVPSNKINYINVYFNKLVNNLYIITLHKLHTNLSCESRLTRSSCRVCRAMLFDKLDTAKMHGLDTSNVSSVSCRDVTSQVEFGLYCVLVSISGLYFRPDGWFRKTSTSSELLTNSMTIENQKQFSKT